MYEPAEGEKQESSVLVVSKAVYRGRRVYSRMIVNRKTEVRVAE